MGRSRETFGKKEKEKKKQKKKQEKLEKKLEKKEQPKNSSLEDMMAYVDEFGNIVDTPPEPSRKSKIDLEDIEISVPKKEEIQIDAVRKGRVDFFNHDKGYGFIKENDTNESYFFHINATEEEVDEQDKVSFELEKGPKGLNAVKVRKTTS